MYKEKKKEEMKKSDTIAAISTPRGKGAISCIRISGSESEKTVRKLTDYPFGKEKKHAVMVPCRFKGRICDKIMAVLYYGEKSFTGEESAELYFHGGIFLTEQALFSILDSGIRLAEPGEFTRRAFLNGKIDLTQAEGISDLIEGECTESLSAAFEQSEGKIKKAVDALYEKIKRTTVGVEVCIDYPEEDIEEQSLPQLRREIGEEIQAIRNELEGYESGRIKRKGARVVLTGKTNAGKSTLFNTLLQTERAIVSDEEGTTRDTIEEKVSYKGVSFVLIDTAGLRPTQSKAEQLGIERSKEAAQDADIVLHVVREEETGKKKKTTGKKVIYIRNSSKNPTEEEIRTRKECGEILLNAKSGVGIQALQDEIYRRIKDKTERDGNINNERHYAALKEAEKCLMRADDAARNLTLDCVCSDLFGALEAIGKITGKKASEAVINEIFSKFCVGK